MDETLVVCNIKEWGHHVESILTNCSKCNAEVWCSVTNAHMTPICMPCVGNLEETPEIGVTEETLEEAVDYLKKEEENGSKENNNEV